MDQANCTLNRIFVRVLPRRDRRFQSLACQHEHPSEVYLDVELLAYVSLLLLVLDQDLLTLGLYVPQLFEGLE